jgi:hypothetical protein
MCSSQRSHYHVHPENADILPVSSISDLMFMVFGHFVHHPPFFFRGSIVGCGDGSLRLSLSLAS